MQLALFVVFINFAPLPIVFIHALGILANTFKVNLLHSNALGSIDILSLLCDLVIYKASWHLKNASDLHWIKYLLSN